MCVLQSFGVHGEQLRCLVHSCQTGQLAHRHKLWDAHQLHRGKRSCMHACMEGHRPEVDMQGSWATVLPFSFHQFSLLETTSAGVQAPWTVNPTHHPVSHVQAHHCLPHYLNPHSNDLSEFLTLKGWLIIGSSLQIDCSPKTPKSDTCPWRGHPPFLPQHSPRRFAQSQRQRVPARPLSNLKKVIWVNVGWQQSGYSTVQR